MDKEKYENYHENKSHTTPGFPFNIYLCSIPLDFPEVATHWHNEAELIVIKKGRGIVEVDLKSIIAEEGNMIFILPGHLHSIRQDKNSVMEYENIIFEPDFIDLSSGDVCENLLSPLFEGKLSYKVKIDKSLCYYENAAELIDKIDMLCSNKSYGYQLGVKGALISFFHLIISSHTETTSTLIKERSIEKIKLILSYISENYTRKITIEEASQVCYYSSSHFMKFFKESMGEGFIKYLNNYRLRIAARLLRFTDESITDIAGNTGFENLSYFNRSFKKRFGVTPGQYRNGKKID